MLNQAPTQLYTGSASNNSVSPQEAGLLGKINELISVGLGTIHDANATMCILDERLFGQSASPTSTAQSPPPANGFAEEVVRRLEYLVESCSVASMRANGLSSRL